MATPKAVNYVDPALVQQANLSLQQGISAAERGERAQTRDALARTGSSLGLAQGAGSAALARRYADMLSQQQRQQNVQFGQLGMQELARQEAAAQQQQQFDASLAEQQRQFRESLAFQKQQLAAQQSAAKTQGMYGLLGAGLGALGTFGGAYLGYQAARPPLTPSA